MDFKKALSQLWLTFLGLGLFWGVIGGLLLGAGSPLGAPLFTVGMIFMSLMITCAVLMRFY